MLGVWSSNVRAYNWIETVVVLAGLLRRELAALPTQHTVVMFMAKVWITAHRSRRAGKSIWFELPR